MKLRRVYKFIAIGPACGEKEIQASAFTTSPRRSQRGVEQETAEVTEFKSPSPFVPLPLSLSLCPSPFVPLPARSSRGEGILFFGLPAPGGVGQQPVPSQYGRQHSLCFLSALL